MNIEEKIQESNLNIAKEKIKYNEEMKNYTTFKIGGLADCLIKINSIDDLKKILKFAQKEDIPITILGNGSNVLISDDGIEGIVLLIRIKKFEIQKTNQENKVKIIVGAGEKNAEIARKLLEQKLTGFEEIAGIPGTIGGAIRMNAGAYGKEIRDIVKKVKVISYQGIEKEFTNEEMKFNYRSSILKDEKYIVTQVELELKSGNKEEIELKMKEYAQSRKEKQPIEYPNAGSTFKRGEDFITAKLIDEAGLKGYSIGDAEVSKKHAGFVINKGNATAKEVKELIEYIEMKIYKKFGKEIELEIEEIGR